MKTALLPVGALLISVAFLLMASGLLIVLLPVRGLLQNFSAFDIGALGAAYYTGFASGCLLGPRMVRRVGHIRTFATSASLLCSLSLVFSLFDSSLVWWLARAATGFCFATLYIVIESWLNERADNKNRGLIFSVYTTINLTVITAGQMALTLANPQEFFLFALTAILISLSTVPVAMSTSMAPAPLTNIRVRLRYLFECSPVGVVGCFGVGLANGAFWTLAPVFAQHDSGDTGSVAVFMSLAVIAGALGQLPLGRLSDQMDRRHIIMGACIGAAIGAITLIVMPQFFPGAIYWGAVLFGIFCFPVYAICAAHLNDYVEPGEYVEASSGLLMVFALGAIAGPLLASLLMRIQGPSGLFIFIGGIHLCIAGYSLYRCRRRAPPPAEDRASFTETLVMSKMAAEIDPRPISDQKMDNGNAEKINAEGTEDSYNK